MWDRGNSIGNQLSHPTLGVVSEVPGILLRRSAHNNLKPQGEWNRGHPQTGILSKSNRKKLGEFDE